LTVRVSRQARSELPDITVRHIAERVLAGEKRRGGGILSIVLVDDTAIRDLNFRFLRKDRPTDVIAFPLGDVKGIWGEVYVSMDRTRQHAKDFGVPPEEELARCVIHGVLHLLGYDDGTVREREEMRGKEEEYLGRVGRLLRPVKT
jgi:probable rRNA maturation factor